MLLILTSTPCLCSCHCSSLDTSDPIWLNATPVVCSWAESDPYVTARTATSFADAAENRDPGSPSDLFISILVQLFLFRRFISVLVWPFTQFPKYLGEEKEIIDDLFPFCGEQYDIVCFVYDNEFNDIIGPRLNNRPTTWQQQSISQSRWRNRQSANWHPGTSVSSENISWSSIIVVSLF